MERSGDGQLDSPLFCWIYRKLIFKQYGTASNREKRYLETLIIVSLLGISITLFFFSKLENISAVTEQRVVQQSLSTFRMAVQLYTLRNILLAENVTDIRNYANTNPIAMMTTVPGNYIGEYLDVEQVSIPDGSWYFDLNAKELAYKVIHAGVFPEQQRNGELRYQLRVASRDLLVNNTRSVIGLRLETSYMQD